MMDVIKAVRVHAEAATTLASLGSMFLDDLAETATPPYWFIQGLGSPLTEAFGTTYIQTADVQINAIGSDPTVLKTYETAIKARFDRQKFAIDNGTVIACQRKDSGIRSYAKPDGQGRSMHRLWLRYQIKVNRSF